MSMKQGFNVIEKEETKEHGIYTGERISAIKMFQKIKKEELENNADFFINGFENLISNVADYEKFSDFLRDILSEKINYLNRQTNTFQIEISPENGEIENWNDKPCIKDNDGNRYSLFKIFRDMDIEEDNPNWYYSQLNINS